mmetsp:Transcript_14983/g.24799  ORF Transcript_14983/g.24799 Transcript_14983/m.24799 type:complete len:471 (-) Transcript_14983:678-2090(-)|eukprot:CAMPEP_0114423316 /NCGR_PEP_ID=MMETSP0103-20121206/6084_1 /TAXON_ID=37642 ORGANISM="Paraphysomonas imperforata, Strain PA2" /NCGR_SAMPLE_ID=MMETSP0103 /ASSEMBLY_ACC=CAM_ASM_000201 /LENGTH=470 /DNA_ID=CAMNT_0001591971 /DNA_START=210 /DNA_END=1622 /DNA_ORIENTATION=-
MSWQALAGAGGAVKYSNEEVERLRAKCESLEVENEQLRVEKDSLLNSRKALKENVLEKEQARQALLKKLNKSEINLKLEVKARDGISKKVNKFEYEMLNYKDECANMKEELGMLRVKVQELTYNLNQERAKRLRDIHEMDILKRRNVELEAENSVFSKDHLAAQTSLYEKLEKMDTVMTHNESQKRVIASMGSEVNALNSEVAMVKEDLRRSQEAKYSFEQSLSMKDRQREQLETEVFRLRKELIGFSGTHGQKQKAFELSGVPRTAMNSALTLGSPGGGSFDDPFAFAGGQLETSTQLRANTQPGRRLEGSVVSESSAPYAYRSNESRTGTKNNSDSFQLPPAQKASSGQHLVASSSAEGKRHRNAPFGAPLQSPNAEIRASASTSEVMGQYLAPPLRVTDPGSNHYLSKARSSKGKSASANFSHTPKSRFTGSGLGLKKGEELEFQPQGSAKMIIDRVLQKQLEERGS